MQNTAGSTYVPPRRIHAALITVALTVIALVLVPSAPARADDSAAKAGEARYTNAPCNAARKDYLATSFARCFALVRTALDHRVVADADQPPPDALGPADIQSAYKLPATGEGQTVAVVDAFGDSQVEADLAVFRAEYGLPPCTTANGCFRKTDQSGGTNYPPDDAGWALETSLDVDAVSAACPNCHILLVQGTDNGLESLGAAVDTAVSLGAKYVSNSYGVPGEAADELGFDHFYNHTGVAVTASTGDAGNVTNWPATNPNVIAAGGTTLTQDSSARGWHESAWAAGGSGCSPFEPKPDFQVGLDTNCANRAIADISADADPNSGLAVYDTIPFQGQSGWFQVGGTSLSSPLIASMYALAGTPVAGTYPVSYPYQAAPSTLFDVTEGTNGNCGNLLCQAGPGWDGPTGLGTPNGVDALQTGPHGVIAGQVTDGGTSAPIAGATVKTPDGFSATTEANGHYSMSVPVGSYDVTAQAFGYQAKMSTAVQVTDSATTTVDFALDSVPSHVVSGTVTDGSGHAWPLYAKIAIDGYPGGAVYTDPYTGHYSVNLPEQSDFTLHVAPVAPGYTAKDLAVHVGTSDQQADAQLEVDQVSCTAPGYAYSYSGAGTQFTGWTGNTGKDGWTNVDNHGAGEIWQFDNPGNRAVPPGGDGDFAVLDSDHYGPGHAQDSSLVSPVADLSGLTSPEIGFDSFYRGYFNSIADVDLSLDGGATWANVWHQTTTDASGHVDIPIPQAAGLANVQARFHYSGAFAWWWEFDNAFVGTRSCTPLHGGLVAGVVTDDNTGGKINGAKVANSAGEFGASAATPDDANLSDGFYWLFSSQTGNQQFTATSGKYTPASATVNVATNFVTHQDWTLKAGHLTVTPGSVAVSETLGVAKTKNVTIANDGTQPVHVKLAEQAGTFTPMDGQAGGASLQMVKATTSPAAKSGTRSGAGAPPAAATPSAPPWTAIADYPKPVMDNAVATDDAGKVYSIGGTNGSANFASSYVYDPQAQQWSPIADVPVALNAAAAAFLNGKVYVVAGWNAAGSSTSGLYVYDPADNSWSQAASMPKGVSAPAAAVLDGQLYVVGGCTTNNCAPTSKSAFRYDPGSDSWTALADYPVAVAFPACAGVAGEVVCAGGINAESNQGSKATYIYDPGSDSWAQAVNLPVDVWGMAYSGASNKLQIVGGAINNGAQTTNQALEYDPATNTWTALPNANNVDYRGGGGCGLYKIGGSSGGFNPQSFAEVLPGLNQCGGGTDVPWLSASTSEFDVAPGASVAVLVTMDSSLVAQPGDYAAKLAISTNTPYSFAPVGVTMQVAPPKAWGKIAGTVTDATNASPLTGVTVQVGTFGGTGQVSFTLKTDKSGHYQLWLDARYSPLQVIAAKDGYQPQVKSVKVTKGAATTTNFALKKS